MLLCIPRTPGAERPRAQDVKIEKQENRDREISDHDTKLCAMIREERAEELARTGICQKCCQEAPRNGFCEERPGEQ